MRKKLLRMLVLASLLPISLLAQKNVQQTSAQPNADPKANQKAVVVEGNARFTVLTPELIRLEWNEKGQFEDRASLAILNRNLPVPNFKASRTGNLLTIQTDKVKLTYKKGERFTQSSLQVEFVMNGKTVVWYPGLKDDQNLKGTMRTLDKVNGWAIDSLENGLVSKSGWALVDESKRHLFDGDKDWNWVIVRPAGETIDWYLFAHGHNFKKALYEFTQVAGKIPMPPKFTFGYWWSKYWVYSDNEFKSLVEQIRSYNIPLDVLVVDMDWHETWGLTHKNYQLDQAGQRKGWTGYTWHPELFPNPKNFLEWSNREHVKTSLNLHPASGIQPFEKIYPAFAKAYGWDTTGQKYIPYKMDEKKWAKVYFETVLSPMEKEGVDFWWLDWQQWKYSEITPGLNNTFWLNYTFITNMEKQGKRPLLYHRWGGLGNHRYQIGFSGDTYISWESLEFQPYFTATAANVGYGYWSHDIGGHMLKKNGPKVNGERYMRWIQYGVFSPILRTHSTKTLEIERRPWKFIDQFDNMRAAIRLRYDLVPYIYGAARDCYDTGISLCRPMYYDYPEEQNAYDYKEQYMFGNDILVAPIVSPKDSLTGMSARSLWLPKGDWFDMSTGNMVKGDYTGIRYYTQEEIPYFAKAGSIIPMNPGNVMSLQKPIDTLVLTVVPGASGSVNYYEDNGDDNRYSTEFAKTKITKTTLENGTIRIVIDPRKGKFAGMRNTRTYELRLLNTFPAKAVKVNGKSLPLVRYQNGNDYTYDAYNLANIIHTGVQPCAKSVVIEISFDDLYKGKLDLLNGKAGLFKRFVIITDEFKCAAAEFDRYKPLPNLYFQVSQTPNFINEDPKNILNYLQQFEQKLPRLMPDVFEKTAIKPEVIQKINVKTHY